jgi:cysteine desulfurase
MAHRRPSEVQVITQATEHPAVLEACRALHRRYGTEVTYRPVGPGG